MNMKMTSICFVRRDDYYTSHCNSQIYVDHIDGHEANNREDNLLALYVEYHPQQPSHGNMIANTEYNRFVATTENSETDRNT